ncbi:DUF4193 domain-containing protein [Corynebacterium lizhenjunii]|uniref:DUF4193 domain-containing protein n=1 Tax=Corynebacterium lizhenjunii TaxID=2709394 RepID=A0A7T0KCN2_9CORY|nr:DUF4193 domain-containing protein [Corynebacterium lizhenjunii]QPK78323.1 DUF4193 domain-containing protein [Corynebacterium lizhenjunii]
MATDYDAPRRRVEDEAETDSLEGLKAAENDNNGMDDDGDIVDSFEPPMDDLTGEELNVEVIPRQDNEFTCSSCFLVQSNKRLSHMEGNDAICMDCA